MSIGYLVNKAFSGRSIEDVLMSYLDTKLHPFRSLEEPAATVAPYVPGVKQVEGIKDSYRYWSDYEKNTGKKRRYPGIQTHAPDIADAVNAFEWWKP